MNLKITKSRITAYSLFALTALAIYFPSIVREFGFHNDYAFLMNKGSVLMNFPESQHLAVIGRLLGGILISLESHLINSVSDFSVARLLSLMILADACCFLALFLQQRHSLNLFWSMIIAGLFFLLPGNQLNILWAANFIPGILNLYLSLFAYFLLSQDDAPEVSIRAFFRRKTTIAAFVITLAALFIYPLTALFQTALTFAFILFSPANQWTQTRRIIVRDIAFICMAMSVYIIIDRVLVQPLVLPLMHISPVVDMIYVSDITLNLFEKSSYIRELAVTSLAGHFHLFLGSAAARSAAIAGCVLLLISVIFKQQPINRNVLKQYAETTFWLTVLFAISIVPLIIAKNYNDIGYRLLLVPSLMFILLFTWMIRRIYLAAQTTMVKIALMILIGVILGLQMAGTCVHAGAAAENRVREIELIRRIMRSADLNAVDTIIFIPAPFRSGHSLTGQTFRHEFGFLIENIDHAAPVVMEEMRRQEINKEISLFCLDDFSRPVDEVHTLAIDLRNYVFPVNTK